MLTIRRVALTALFTSMGVTTPAAADKLRTLYSFTGGMHGIGPAGVLAYNGGIFYGTTANGGTGCGNAGCGTVYSYDPKTKIETILHAFTAGPDGEAPLEGVIYIDGFLYGTTIEGGGTGCENHQGCGTVFKVDTRTGQETVLHAFRGRHDGQNPSGGLVAMGDELYGTTYLGGSTGGGVIYTVNIRNRKESVVYTFTGIDDGNAPTGTLLPVGGILYGTARSGGAHQSGVVFAFDPLTRGLTTVYGFGGTTDGFTPEGGVIYENGILYGTTVNGGSTYGTPRCIGNGCGTLFAIDTRTTAHTIVHNFLGAYYKGPDGAFPTTPPKFVNSALYGTAPYGGHDGNGVLYAVSTSTGQESIRAKFDASGGPSNAGNLSYFHGTIYGPLDSSGSDGFGEIFELKP